MLIYDLKNSLRKIESNLSSHCTRIFPVAITDLSIDGHFYQSVFLNLHFHDLTKGENLALHTMCKGRLSILKELKQIAFQLSQDNTPYFLQLDAIESFVRYPFLHPGDKFRKQYEAVDKKLESFRFQPIEFPQKSSFCSILTETLLSLAERFNLGQYIPENRGTLLFFDFLSHFSNPNIVEKKLVASLESIFQFLFKFLDIKEDLHCHIIYSISIRFIFERQKIFYRFMRENKSTFLEDVHTFLDSGLFVRPKFLIQNKTINSKALPQDILNKFIFLKDSCQTLWTLLLLSTPADIAYTIFLIHEGFLAYFHTQFYPPLEEDQVLKGINFFWTVLFLKCEIPQIDIVFRFVCDFWEVGRVPPCLEESFKQSLVRLNQIIRIKVSFTHLPRDFEEQQIVIRLS